MTAGIKISVCIPTYNYARFLPEALESVLRQDHPDFEVVVQDDCSTDDTVEVVRRYAEADARIRFERNAANLGLVGNWNRCLERSNGDYIKFLFADDVLGPDVALSRLADVLDRNAEVVLVGSPRNVIDEDSRFLYCWADFRGDLTVDGKEVIRRCVRWQGNLIGEPTVVMFRKRHAARGFSTRYRHLADLEMWFHLLEQGTFSFLGEPLSSFRVHRGQMTARNLENMADLDDLFLLLDDYLHKPYLHMGPFLKWMSRTDASYRFWKLSASGALTRGEALRRIRRNQSPWKFLALFPCYKVCKPVVKFLRSLSGPEVRGAGAFLGRAGK